VNHAVGTNAEKGVMAWNFSSYHATALFIFNALGAKFSPAIYSLPQNISNHLELMGFHAPVWG
jgi:hypothetical protein